MNLFLNPPIIRAVSGFSLLDRRARNRTKETIYTAITLLGLEHSMAAFAFVKPLTCIGWHGFSFLMPT
jgi:hypothetical protein